MNTFLGGRSLSKTLTGVVLLVTGLAMLTFVVFNLAQDVSLWALGQRTTARVVDRWIEQTSEDGARESTFRYFVRYQFATPNGRVVTGTSSVGVQEWAGLGMGGPVKVVY